MASRSVFYVFITPNIIIITTFDISYYKTALQKRKIRVKIKLSMEFKKKHKFHLPQWNNGGRRELVLTVGN